MPQAIIKRVSHGKLKGQFRFVLTADNHEIIATSEIYTQKHNITDLLKTYFDNFDVIDETYDKRKRKSRVSSESGYEQTHEQS